MPDQVTKANAGIALARIALALSLYRAERGAYPETLDTLVPDYLPRLDLDPFSLRPVRYKRGETTFTVYGVGLDMVDDGGAGDDVVWTQYAPGFVAVESTDSGGSRRKRAGLPGAAGPGRIGRRRRGRFSMSRGWKIFFAAVIGVVALFFGVRAWVFHGYNVKVREELRLLAEEGGAETPADLVARRRALRPRRILPLDAFTFEEPRNRPGAVKFIDPAVSEEDKIGSAYEKVWSWRGLTGYVGDPRTLLSRERNWNENWLPYLEKISEANADALANVRRETDARDGAFDVDWSAGFQAQLPHLSRIRTAARLLVIDAVVRARKGDSAAALDDVRTALRLRRLIDDEPALISQLVSYATDSISLAGLHAALEEGQPDRAGCEAVLAELEEREEANRLTRTFLGETAMGLHLFEAVRRDPSLAQDITGSQQPRSTAQRTALRVLSLGWVAPADTLNYLTVMRKLRETSRMERPLKGPSPTASLPARSAGNLPTCVLTQMLVPALGSALTQQARSDARVRMARMAVALALYRADHGDYPETLDAFVPEYAKQIERDPIDGEPIRYVKTSQGYVLYSIDIDNRDDLGAPGLDNIWLVGDELATQPLVEATNTE